MKLRPEATDAATTFGMLLTMGFGSEEIKLAMIESCDTGLPYPLGDVRLWSSGHGDYSESVWEVRT